MLVENQSSDPPEDSVEVGTNLALNDHARAGESKRFSQVGNRAPVYDGFL